MLSAVVSKGDTTIDNKDLEETSIDEFINDLPGYSAQNTTFILMIGFLIIISAFVIGIFIYVLTLQKESVFGVMKAQGISNSYLIGSVLYQTGILSFVGIAPGMLLTYVTSIFLPDAVPFMLNWQFIGIIALLMLVFALLGGLFSSRLISKIDPLEAI